MIVDTWLNYMCFCMERLKMLLVYARVLNYHNTLLQQYSKKYQQKCMCIVQASTLARKKTVNAMTRYNATNRMRHIAAHCIISLFLSFYYGDIVCIKINFSAHAHACARAHTHTSHQ